MCNKDIAAYNKIYNGRNKLYNSLGAIYFYFLKDTTAATDAYAKAGDKYDGTQIQFHLAMGNWPKAYSQIKRWINSGNNSYVYQLYQTPLVN